MVIERLFAAFGYLYRCREPYIHIELVFRCVGILVAAASDELDLQDDGKRHQQVLF